MTPAELVDFARLVLQYLEMVQRSRRGVKPSRAMKQIKDQIAVGYTLLLTTKHINPALRQNHSSGPFLDAVYNRKHIHSPEFEQQWRAEQAGQPPVP